MKPVTDPAVLAALNADVPKAVRDPVVIANLDYGLDFTKDEKAIRGRIAQLPETEKKRALDLWADHRVTREGVMPRAPAKGIPIIGQYLDEATAGIQAGLHSVSGGRIGEPYDEGLALERARQRAAEAKFPAESAVGNLAAGIVTGGPLLSRIAPAATLVGRVGQGAVIGAGIGAAEGYGAGEGSVGKRLQTAQSGGAVGAGLGAAMPVVASAATRGVGMIADAVSPTLTRLRHGPDQAAEDILARRIASEGSSPAAKRLDLQQGQAQDARLNTNSNAYLPEALADTSDAMRRLTGSVYRAGGEAGNYVQGALNARQRGPANPYAPQPANAPPDGQMARIEDAAARAMLIRSSNTAYRTEQQIMRDQAREGNRLYTDARNNSEAFDLQPTLDSLALTAQQYPGQFRSKLLRALSLFRDETPQRMPVNNIARFDSAKKALDDMIDTAQRQGNGNLNRELTQFKNALLDAVHQPDATGAPTRNLIYRQAREAWGSAAENRSAIELGRGALREGSETSIDQYRALTPGQQQLFRIGLLESVRNSMGGKRPGNDITQIFQQRRVQELMTEVIPRSRGSNATFSNRPERFGDLLGREERMVQTRNAVLGNSQTAQRQQDDMGFTGDALAGMWNRFRQSPSLFNMGIEAVGVGIQKVFGYRQDVALAMARRLLETNPEQRNQLLRRLNQRGGPNVFARFADHVDRSSQSLIGATAGPLQVEDGRGTR